MADMHEYCKDCPGPALFEKDYKHIFGKISQMCLWKDNHEKDQKEYREKREVEEKKHREKIDDKFGALKNWAIGNLVALCFLLAGTIIILIRTP